MTFLAFALLATVIAMLAVVAPYLRAPTERPDMLDYDRNIYRARLAEIDADLELGRLAQAEAETAKAEEARKLLAVSADQPRASATKSHLFPILAAIVFIPVTAALFYWNEGSPQMPDMALAERPDRDLSQQSINQLLERAEARLAAQPEDLRGWLVVAPVYLRMGRADDAVNAYRNALRLSPDDADLKTALAEAMVVQGRGVVTERANALFREALAENPSAAKPRFYLAIALGQQGDFEEAATAWTDLIADAPPQAPWLETARAQLAAVRERLGQPAPEVAENEAPGPSAEDIEAASQLSADDRQAMILSMVEGLAQKLQDAPDDKAGWRRLIRSYTVLGKNDEAREAIATARGHFDNDTAFLAELQQIEKSLGSGDQTQ